MFSMTVTPRFYETDALGHINNTVVSGWFETGREPVFRLFNPELALDAWNLILARVEIDYVAQIRYGGEVTLLTGIGGEAWLAAAEAVGAELGLPIRTHLIGPRRPIEDHGGDWARASEIRDAGCLLVRPDHHVAWRSEALSAEPAADLRRVLTSILAR